ncbi:hypothetical protein [Aquincola sp. J276]|uniref:hypothetical protein n=1 Tax=Aquincola sp. J276 TaxID=2898432 RepID=UPI0021516A6A|nr:hypothetical protein [Aquincola sp. J276]MCR5867839.1 hypothetical protein [Aquincola sp. J276]
MHYLRFDTSDSTDGIHTLEALASTRADRHAAVMAEVRQVLDWARQHHLDGPGPLDEGHGWDHDLAVSHEDGGWVAVSLTLTGSEAFAQSLLATFGADDDE